MLQSLYTGASAVDAYSYALATTANNIANINTPYYKSNSLQLSSLKQGGVHVASIRQNQQQSYTIQSGGTLDFVIDGSGQFKLDDNGQSYYTRNGVFHADANGDIVDSKGRTLLTGVLKNGEDASMIQVDKSGTVIVNDQIRGNIDTYNKQGEKISKDQYQVQAGKLEASNVDAAKEIVNMMLTERAMEANYASIRTSNEMLGLIVDMVA